MKTFTLWIKEKQVDRFGNYIGFGFAYHLRGPDQEREVCEKEARPAPALNGMVLILTEIVSQMPSGTHLHISADFDALVMAFDGRARLAAWRSDRFKDRPHWANLDALLGEKRITVSAILGKAAKAPDQEMLQALSDRLALQWPRKTPKPRRKNYRERGPNDDAFRHALDKPEDFAQRTKAQDRTSEDDDEDGSDKGPPF